MTNAAKAAEDAQTATQKIAGVVGSVQSIGTGLEKLENDLNLYVKDGDVINQINIDATGVVIDGKKVTITGETSIASGVIGTAQIADGSIGTAKIANAAIGTAQIANAAIGTAQVSTIAANKISAASLSAISANLGAITAGSPVNGIYPFEVATNGAVAANSLTLDNAYNLVYNSEFYANGLGWDVRNGYETAVAGTVLVGQGYQGSNAIGITTQNVNFNSQHVYTELTGKTVSISVWVKAHAAGDTLNLVFSDRNGGGQVLQNYTASHKTAGTWEQLKLENIAVKGTAPVFYIQSISSGAVVGSSYALLSQPMIIQQATTGTYLPNSAIKGGWIVDSHMANTDINNYDSGNKSRLDAFSLEFADSNGYNSSISANGWSMVNGASTVDISPGRVIVENTDGQAPLELNTNRGADALSVRQGNVTLYDGSVNLQSGNIYLNGNGSSLYLKSSGNIYANPSGSVGGITNSFISGYLVVGGTGHRIYTTDVGGIYFGVSTSTPETLHAAKYATYSLASIKRDIEPFNDKTALDSILATDVYSWRHKFATDDKEELQISPVIDDVEDGGYKIGDNILDIGGETLNSTNMIGLLFGAVKQLKRELDAK